MKIKDMNDMSKTKKNEAVLAICIQETEEDGSELNIGDYLLKEEIEFLHQAFIADTLVNILDLKSVDFRLFYAGLPKTEKSVNTILKYLKKKLKGRKARILEDELKISILPPERWGIKMEKVFCSCLDEGYKHILFIGSRTPTLKADMLKTALKLLKNSDAIFGPTVEGRYYLLGMTEKCHVKMSQFDWKSPTIYAEVANHFKEQGLTWSELELWYAVEHHEDLEYLIRDINQYRLEGDEISAKETEIVLDRYLNR
ncbi:MAG: hypothetical protein CVT49_08335 [candidate division Zixibacteria bacterium HGW-Zixibacteria-1]|nr:MAG: hypothetical protein CVT49_08335 [candidate division Zixibacteria bacterium HGW-Zixibacteria-1]